MTPPNLNMGKFCCFALQMRTSSDLRSAIQLDPNVYACAVKPFDIDEFWRENLGALEVAAIERSTLFLTLKHQIQVSKFRILKAGYTRIIMRSWSKALGTRCEAFF